MASSTMHLPSRRIKDITGKRVGKLTVTRFLEQRGNAGVAYWLCRCDCGNTVELPSGEINRKPRFSRPRSCGCSQVESVRETHTKHGMTGSPEYAAWGDMLARCRRPDHAEFPRYGGRGIKVCPEWEKSFASFLSHIGRRPSSDHSLDRINTDGDYEPGNVRWATRKEQQRNRRCTVFVEFKGKKVAVSELAERFGISRYALYGRLRRGLSVEEALRL